ncbi:MAG: HD domain-containing protein [Spirochaetia bacterium]|nr:HD domain-containing protein [Spirochaetia bacterium]
MKLRILNLEDNPNDTELALIELSKEWPDVDIIRVDTRDDFILSLEKNNFDLILCDLSLPQFDGFSALSIVINKYPHIPFIFLSGAMGEESAIETLKKGATDFIIKGRLFRLIPAVRRALEEAQKHKKQIETEEKIKNEMEITSHLLMISEATAQITDINKLLKQIVSCGHEIMKYEYCLIYLFNKDTSTFRPVEKYGLSSEMNAGFMTEFLPYETAFIQESLEKKGINVISKLSKSNKLSGAFSFIKDKETLVVIPLFARQEPIGMIFSFYKEEMVFEERQKKIMLGIAHQASVAIDQARLYRDSIERSIELSARVETIQVMNEIDKSILSTLNIWEILENVTHLVSRLIPCEMSNVFMVDKENEGFIFAAGFGVRELSVGDLIPFHETSSTEILQSGKIEYIANLLDIKKRLSYENKLVNEEFLSFIRIPLYIRNDITAVFSIGSKRSAAFSVENLSTLEKLSDQVGVALQNAKYLSDLEELFLGTVKALSSTIDAKSPWTQGHSVNVTRLALQIGEKMALSKKELKNLELGALLHDIGKLGTYESILNKPGKLTDEEYSKIKEHPEKGAEILSPITQLKNIIPAIRHHHEFYNGKGYPTGLKGNEIPQIARIVCVADSVDAMSFDRPYRKAMPREEIINELKTQSGKQFDPDIVDIFLQIY